MRSQRTTRPLAVRKLLTSFIALTSSAGMLMTVGVPTAAAANVQQAAPAAVHPMAMVTDSTVDTLAAQIVNASVKVQSDPIVKPLAAPILKILTDPGFNWQQVMFGTGSLSASQQKTANMLLSGIRTLGTFSVTSQTDAVTLINGIITNMQGLNPVIQASDAVAFLQSLDSSAFSALVPLAYQQGTTPITAPQVAAALQTAFASSVASSSAGIQAIFSAAGPGSSGTSTGGTSGGGSTGGGQGSVGTTGNTLVDALLTALQTKQVDASGAAITGQAGGATVELDVPSNALSSAEDITLTSADAAKMNAVVGSQLPISSTIQAAFGVSFSGTAPVSPVTLTITDADISPTSAVYKVTSAGLTPVQAKLTAGEAVITFAADPFFVIASSSQQTGTGSSQGGTSGSNQGGTSGTGSNNGGATQTGSPGGHSSSHAKHSTHATVYVHGKKLMNVPVLTQNRMTYMPLSDIMQVLRHVGIQTVSSGSRLQLGYHHHAVNFKALKPGKGSTHIYLNGKLVQNVSGIRAVDATTGHMTTYLPVAYVMAVLKRAGVVSALAATSWKLN